MNKFYKKKIVIAITGASGSVYADNLIYHLSKISQLFIVISKIGLKVIKHELNDGLIINKILNDNNFSNIKLFDIDDIFADIASGSFYTDAMVIIPCSMGTLSRVANGISSNLIERAADVTIKNKKKLIICPRETPFNSIHLINMLKISDMGNYIVPPIPAFYYKPQSLKDIINFNSGKILEILNIDHNLYSKWGS